MDLNQCRVIVAGATGVLGGKLARRLHEEGVVVGLIGRDDGKLSTLAGELGNAPTQTCEARDAASCSPAVDEVATALRGLDVLIAATGVAAFGPAEDTDEDTIEHLLAINTHTPIALARAAIPHFGDGGTIAVVSAILADYPTANMAAYLGQGCRRRSSVGNTASKSLSDGAR